MPGAWIQLSTVLQEISPRCSKCGRSTTKKRRGSRASFQRISGESSKPLATRCVRSSRRKLRKMLAVSSGRAEPMTRRRRSFDEKPSELAIAPARDHPDRRFTGHDVRGVPHYDRGCDVVWRSVAATAPYRHLRIYVYTWRSPTRVRPRRTIEGRAPGDGGHIGFGTTAEPSAGNREDNDGTARSGDPQTRTAGRSRGHSRPGQ